MILLAHQTVEFVDSIVVRARMVLGEFSVAPRQVMAVVSGRISSLVVMFVLVHSVMFQFRPALLLLAMEYLISHFQSVS